MCHHTPESGTFLRDPQPCFRASAPVRLPLTQASTHAGHLFMTCFQIPFQTQSSCMSGQGISAASGPLRLVPTGRSETCRLVAGAEKTSPAVTALCPESESMMNHNKVVTPVSPFSLLVSPVHASRNFHRRSRTNPCRDRFFFSRHCRARHYSSDGHEVGKKTTTSRHRGESPKPKTNTKHKPNTKNQTTPSKRLPKKARTKGETV